MIQMGSGKAYLKQERVLDSIELDTNIFVVRFSDLKEEENTIIHQGNPIQCQNCKGILNKYSTLYLSSIIQSSASYNWSCEFCNHHNNYQIKQDQIPSNEETLYLIEPGSKDEQLNESSIIFCIDNSGSMSTTTEIKGKVQSQQRLTEQEYQMLKQFIEPDVYSQYLLKFQSQQQQVNYVSRKQCVHTAIKQQIQKLKKNNPEKLVGLITFNNEINIYGDGSQQPIILSGQQLYQEQEIKNIINKSSHRIMQNPISKSSDNLIKSFEQLEENGQTALGPALVSALEIAKVSKPGSMIIVCTDGLANLGLGTIDGYSNKQFYEQLGQLAAERGIIISLVTIIGEGCKIDTLGALVEKTNGIVTRVKPEKIGKDFANIINNSVIATQVELKVILHKALQFRDEENIQTKNIIEKYIGNVTKTTIQSFEYQLKTEYELKNQGVNMNSLKKIPIQIRIKYTNLKGDKMMKVYTKLVQTTQDIEEAEKEAQVGVIHKRIAQKTSQLAKQGDYQQAQIYNQNWGQYINSNPNINSSIINQEKNCEFQKHNHKLSNALKNQEARKQKSQQFSGNINQQETIKVQSENFKSIKTTQNTSDSIRLLPNQEELDSQKNSIKFNNLEKENNSSKLKSSHDSLQETNTSIKSIVNFSAKDKLGNKIESYSSKLQEQNSISNQESNIIFRQDTRSIINIDQSNENSTSSSNSDEDSDYTTILFYGKALF